MKALVLPVRIRRLRDVFLFSAQAAKLRQVPVFDAKRPERSIKDAAIELGIAP
jgi:hypothetical protein